MVKSLMDQVIGLPIEERLELISLLCQSVEEQAVLTDEQRDHVRERLEEHRQNPGGVVPWDEARERLRQRYE